MFGLFLKREKRIQIVQRESHKVRLHEFRSDKNLVGMAQAFHKDSNFRLLLDVLRNETPANWGLPRTASAEQRAALQGIIEGYSLALNNLEAMAVYKKQIDMEQPTFEPEEENK